MGSTKAAPLVGSTTLHQTASRDARAAVVTGVTAPLTVAAVLVMTAVSVATAAPGAGFVGEATSATACEEEDCYDRAGASSPCQQRASTPAACPCPYWLGRGCGSAPGTHAPELALLSPPSPPPHPSPVCRCYWWCSSDASRAKAAVETRGRSSTSPRRVAGLPTKRKCQKKLQPPAGPLLSPTRPTRPQDCGAVSPVRVESSLLKKPI